MRDDKDAVLDMLFAAFEKHQYYNIRDLVKITRQPIVIIFLHSFGISLNICLSELQIYWIYWCEIFQVYLKEILNEVCNYNLKNPHRNMWELKPEYRHYKEEEKPVESTSKKDDESEDD